MNRLEFYNKRNSYELQHSSNNYGREYVNKIDNYYSDGSARYFYTQAEWDAYLEGQKRNQYEEKKKDEAVKKLTENMKPIRLEDRIKLEANKAANNYTKNNKYATAEQFKEAEKGQIAAKQKENYEKNKAAAEAQKSAYKKQQDDAYRKSMYEGLTAKAKKHEAELKQKQREENYKANLNSREEAMKKGQEATKKANEEQRKRLEERKKNYEANTKAKEEAMKKGQEATKKANEEQKKTNERNARYEANMKSKQNDINKSNEAGKEADRITENKIKKAAKYKEKSKKEVDKLASDTYKALEKIYNGETSTINVDNYILDMLDKRLKSDHGDDYQGLVRYLRPYVNTGTYLGKDNAHFAEVGNLLVDMKKYLKNYIDNELTPEDLEYNTLGEARLAKKKTKQLKEATNKVSDAINKMLTSSK